MDQAPGQNGQKQYSIILSQDLYFHSASANYESIYRNFCLLSYVTNRCNLKIDIRHYSIFYDHHTLYDLKRQKKGMKNQSIAPERGLYLDKIYLDEFSVITNQQDFHSHHKIKNTYFLVQLAKSEWNQKWKKSTNQQNPDFHITYFLFEEKKFRENYKDYIEEFNELTKNGERNNEENDESFFRKKILKQTKRIQQYSFVKAKFQKKSFFQKQQFKNKLQQNNKKVIMQELQQIYAETQEGEKKIKRQYEELIYCCQKIYNQYCKQPKELKLGEQHGLYKVDVSFMKQNIKAEKFKKSNLKEKYNKKESQKEQIQIKISDPDCFFSKKLTKEESVRSTRRTKNFKIDQQGTYFEYLYQEPINIRTAYMKENHFSLALQGGGVKGVAYIGAYKAFWDYYKKSNLQERVAIKSIIGSSAGGILGLSICCELDAEDMENLVTEYLQYIPKHDKKFKLSHQDQEEMLISQLKNYFIENDFISKDSADFIGKILNSRTLEYSLLKYIKEQLQQQTYLELITVQEGKKLAFYGILMGTLMKGQKIRDIGTHILSLYYKRVYFEKYKLILDQMDYLRNFLKDLTLRQFYEETGIQFTCTAADLDGKILRFLNHKTTPDLPVCYAIQITGSLPIVFEGERWKKQWGKYYIHYDRTRVEKNLMMKENKIEVGHQFTDGGSLDNFPVRFLDNKRVRPKYFSHPRKLQKQKNHTIIYAFGILQIDPDEKDTQHQNSQFFFKENENDDDQEEAKEQQSFVFPKAQYFQEVALQGSSINNPLAYLKLLFSLSNYGTKQLLRWWRRGGSIQIQDNSNEQSNSEREKKKSRNVKEKLQNLGKISKVPMVGFMFKFFKMLTGCKDNLTKQCFAHQCIQFSNYFQPKQEKNQNNAEEFKQKILKIWTIFENVKIQENESNIEQQQKNLIKQKKALLHYIYSYLKKLEREEKQKKNKFQQEMRRKEEDKQVSEIVNDLKEDFKMVENMNFLQDLVQKLKLTKRYEDKNYYHCSYKAITKFRQEDLEELIFRKKQYHQKHEQKIKDKTELKRLFDRIKNFSLITTQKQKIDSVMSKIQGQIQNAKKTSDFQKDISASEHYLRFFQSLFLICLLKERAAEACQISNGFPVMKNNNQKGGEKQFSIQLIDKDFKEFQDMLKDQFRSIEQSQIENTKVFLDKIIKKDDSQASELVKQKLKEENINKINKNMLKIGWTLIQFTKKKDISLKKILCDQFSMKYDTQFFDKIISIKKDKNKEDKNLLSKKMKRFSKSYQWHEINIKVKNLLKKNLESLLKQLEKVNEKGDKRIQVDERMIFKNIQKIEYLLHNFMSQINTQINTKRKYFQPLKNESDRKPVKGNTLGPHLILSLYEKICGLIKQIEDINKLQIFWYSQIVQDANKLSKKLLKVKQEIQSCLENNCSDCQSFRVCPRQFFYKILTDEYADQSEYIFDLMKKFDIFKKKELKLAVEEYQNDKIIKNEVDFDEAQSVYQLSRKLYITQLGKQFFPNVGKLKIPQFKHSKQYYKEAQQMKNQLQNNFLIAKNNQTDDSLNFKSIHLVLESRARSELFFLDFYHEVNDAIQIMNKQIEAQGINENKNQEEITKNLFKITQITGSNYNSLAMFLICMGLPTEELYKKIKQIPDLVEFQGNNQFYTKNYKNQDQNSEKQFDKQFDNQAWLKYPSDKIKQFVSEMMKLEKMRQIIENNLQKKKEGSEQNDKNKIIEATNEAYNQFVEIIEIHVAQVLDFISDNLARKVEPHKIMRLLAGFNMDHRFQRRRRQQIEGTKFIIGAIIKKFQFLLRVLLNTSPFIDEQMKYLKDKPTNKKQKELYKNIWKRIIIGKVLKLGKVKKFVQQTLKNHPLLSENCTMLQFYQKNSKNIQLNFTTLDLTTEKLFFINQKTSPNMPLWAAIVASMSLPFFTEPFKSFHEWNHPAYKSDEQKRNIDFLFKDKQKKAKVFYTGDILARLPIELITNNKIKSIINGIEDERDLNEEVYLIMSFHEAKKPYNFQQETLSNIKQQQDQRQKLEENRLKSEQGNWLKKIKNKKEDLASNIYVKAFNLWFNHGTNFKEYFAPKFIPSISFFKLSSYIVLTIYLNATDNLVKSIYDKEIAIFPLGLKTTDFGKVSQKYKKSILSLKAEETIIQASNVMKQKLSNVNKSYYHKKEENGSQQLSVSKSLAYTRVIDCSGRNIQKAIKQVYMAIKFYTSIFKKQRVKELEKQKVILKFYSLKNETKSVQERYDIFYQLPQRSQDHKKRQESDNKDGETFIRITDEQTEIELGKNKEIKLKFMFPDIVYENSEFEEKDERLKELIHVLKIQRLLQDSVVDQGTGHQKKQYNGEGCYQFKFRYNWPIKNEAYYIKDKPHKLKNSDHTNDKYLKVSIETDLKCCQEIHCPLCLGQFFRRIRGADNKYITRQKQCERCQRIPTHFQCANQACKPMWSENNKPLQEQKNKQYKTSICIRCAYKVKIQDGNLIHDYLEKDGNKRHQIKKLNNYKEKSKKPYNFLCSVCGCSPRCPHYDEVCDIYFCQVCFTKFIRQIKQIDDLL